VEADLNFTEEDLAALADLGISQEKIESIRERMARAEAIRFQDGPEGRQAGRIYTAANPLEHLGQGIQKYRAGRQMQQLQAQQQQELANQASTRQGMMGRILRGAPPPAQPAQPAQPMGGPQMSPNPGPNRQQQLAMMLRGGR
jgi:hypothetical protein